MRARTKTQRNFKPTLAVYSSSKYCDALHYLQTALLLEYITAQHCSATHYSSTRANLCSSPVRSWSFFSFFFFFFFFWLASPFNEPSVFHWKSKSRVALFNLTNVSILYSFFFFLYNYECRKKIRNADPLSFSRVRYAKIREDSRRYVN